MATIPNRYYNSPWIEAAGRNLASALAPEDPDVLRAREQKAFEFDYEKTRAANEATDRAHAETARVAIGDLYKLRSNPIPGADGKPDQDATDKEAYRLAAVAMENGPKEIRGDVDSALFEASPSFRRKKIMQQIVTQAASDRLGRQLAGALEQIQAGGQIKQNSQDDQQQFEMDRLSKLYELRWKELEFKTQAAAKGLGKPPLTITKQLGQEILNGILRREHATGHKLTDEARFALLSDIAQDTQATRDPYYSTQQIWNQRFPQARYTDAPTEKLPDANSWLNNLFNSDFFQNSFLAPQGPNGPAALPSTAPAEAPRDMGTAATTEPVTLNPLTRNREDVGMLNASRAASAAETAAIPLPSNKPARAPVSTGLPPAALKQLREGEITTFGNGQKWTLRNGAPVRVK